MTPDNRDRRKNDQEFRDSMLKFMARIDERNFQKDLNYAVQGDLVADHEVRITVLEHKATRLDTIAGVAVGSGVLAGVYAKFGHFFGVK